MDGGRRKRIGFLIAGILAMAVCYCEGGEGVKNMAGLEVFVLEPVAVESVGVWVLADRAGPDINRACRPREECSYEVTLVGELEHEKTEGCPRSVGRLAATEVWREYGDRIPLTARDGWRWEFGYGAGDYIGMEYWLEARGGSWENCMEATLYQTEGTVCGRWMPLEEGAEAGEFPAWKSHVRVKTFEQIRERYGYPKKRQLQ